MQFSRNPCTFLFMGFDQSAANRRQSCLGLLSIADVKARSDITCKSAVPIESRHTDVQDPTVLSVFTPKAILHFKGFTLIKRPGVRLQAALQVFAVDPFRPAVSQFCLNASACELQPWLIERIAQFVRPRHPDHDRCGVGNESEASFALTDYIRSLFMLLGEGC